MDGQTDAAMMEREDEQSGKASVGGRRVLLIAAIWAIAVLAGMYVFIEFTFWR